MQIMIFLNMKRTEMQFKNMQGLKCNLVWKKRQLNDAVHACRGLNSKNKIKQGKSAMQYGKIRN